ncbi:antibiotic biosynthesis monooxygenase [Streptomyces sp. VRA16 Mangrove soil]|uniref:antibiotic biosynthesis monooxygenase family protein n=1 Tax=Streptomyces sp. VRA16 Mangrove soil TaxID=2817434 RepID=UPI001A9CC76F|nr:antibiotic biosynthesis monooxygenase [Streptomyces sp. VRA16 Mangrove soil]MBO1332627.1 antibiotic biosynthesis monooxygenase [Streptomyces sp. VRA16 Mangrove soil]
MVTMINQLTVTGDEKALFAVLDEICAHMKSRPGFRSLRLHRSLRSPERLVMVAHWQDAAAHAAASRGPEVQRLFQRLRAEARTEPDVYETLLEG